MTEIESPDPEGFFATADAVEYPDTDAAHATRLRLRELAVPAGSLGRLAELAVWAAGVQGSAPPTAFERARAVVFAADHGIAEAGVARLASEATGRLVDLVTGGRAPVNAIADGVPVRVVDAGLATEPATDLGRPARRSSGRIDQADALTAEQTERALTAGMTAADAEIAAGADLLVAGNLGVAASTPASALVAVLTDTEPVRVVGRGDGIDDAAWIRKCAAIRDARRRAWPHRDDPVRLLAVAGGGDLAALAGFVIRAAARKVPVLLDGLVPCAAALVAQLACPRVVRWFCAGQLSGEPAHELALRRLGLAPVLDLGVELDQGYGGLLALPVLRAATRTLAGTSDVTEAGLA